MNAADTDSQTAKQAHTGAVPSQSSSGRGTAGKTTSRTAAADSVMASQAAHVAHPVGLKLEHKPPQDPGESLVGCRLEVYWSGDEEYFPGVVTSFIAKSVSLHSCALNVEPMVVCIPMNACFAHTCVPSPTSPAIQCHFHFALLHICAGIVSGRACSALNKHTSIQSRAHCLLVTLLQLGQCLDLHCSMQHRAESWKCSDCLCLSAEETQSEV